MKLFLAEKPFLNLLVEMVVDFLQEMLPIEKPKLNVVIVKSSEVFLFTVLLAIGGLALKSGNHFFVMTSTLFLIPGSNESAHFYIVALRFIVGIVEQFISLAGQKEVVAQFFLCIPVSNLLCHMKLIFCKIIINS